MKLLVDRNLLEYVNPKAPKDGMACPKPLATEIPSEKGRWNTKIQPSSLDLTVGRILLPTKNRREWPWSKSQPANSAGRSYHLREGETAIVETLEKLNLPSNVAALGFPPSSVSMGGLLMTNPGHIDPGYTGHLRFTVINMARKPYPLEAGNSICTVLFFLLDEANVPEIPFDKLDQTGRKSATSPTNPDGDLKNTLSQLSKDFLSVDDRVRDEVKSQLRTSQIALPVVSGLVAIAVTVIAGVVTTTFTGVADLKAKLEGVEKSLSVQQIQSRVEKIENQQTILGELSAIKTRIEKLETQTNSAK